MGPMLHYDKEQHQHHKSKILKNFYNENKNLNKLNSVDEKCSNNQFLNENYQINNNKNKIEEQKQQCEKRRCKMKDIILSSSLTSNNDSFVNEKSNKISQKSVIDDNLNKFKQSASSLIESSSSSSMMDAQQHHQISTVTSTSHLLSSSVVKDQSLSLLQHHEKQQNSVLELSKNNNRISTKSALSSKSLSVFSSSSSSSSESILLAPITSKNSEIPIKSTTSYNTAIDSSQMTDIINRRRQLKRRRRGRLRKLYDMWNAIISLLLLLIPSSFLMIINKCIVSLSKFYRYMIVFMSNRLVSQILWIIGIAIAITLLPINLVNAISSDSNEIEDENSSYINNTTINITSKYIYEFKLNLFELIELI